MKSSDPLGGLLAQKARTFLRRSTVVLALALVCLAVVTVLEHSRAAAARVDFVANDNMHFLEVSRPSGGEPLHLDSGSQILRSVRQAQPSAVVSVTALLQLNIGMADTSGRDRFIYGLEGEGGSRLLGLGTPLQTDVLYQSDPGPAQIDLMVPQVKATADGGLSSAARTQERFALSSGVVKDNPLRVVGGDLDSGALYCNAETFRRLASSVLGAPWQAATGREGASHAAGMQLVRSYFVHVEQLSQVPSIARTLEADGWSVNYAMRAFDDLNGSLKRSTILSIVALALVGAAAAGYVLITFAGMMRAARKDIGILRHIGWHDEPIRRSYRLITARMIALGMAPALLIVGIGGATVVGELRVIALDVSVLVAFGLILGFVIDRLLIRRTLAVGTLDLLKRERDFE